MHADALNAVAIHKREEASPNPKVTTVFHRIQILGFLSFRCRKNTLTLFTDYESQCNCNPTATELSARSQTNSGKKEMQ